MRCSKHIRAVDGTECILDVAPDNHHRALGRIKLGPNARSKLKATVRPHSTELVGPHGTSQRSAPLVEYHQASEFAPERGHSYGPHTRTLGVLAQGNEGARVKQVPGGRAELATEIGLNQCMKRPPKARFPAEDREGLTIPPQ